MTHLNLVSFVGIFVLTAIAWTFSTNRKVMNWRAMRFWGVEVSALVAATPACFMVASVSGVFATNGGAFLFGK